MRSISKVVWVGLIASLGGCIGPRFETPRVQVVDDWQAKGDPHVDTKKPVQDEWWTTFDDPTLINLIDLAHRQNLSLQVAGLKILEARAQLGVAWGQIFPQFQVAVGQVTAQ